MILKNRIEHRRGRFPAKGKPAGGHFVQDSAKREESGTGIEFLAESLLRRHIGNGAERGARTGKV